MVTHATRRSPAVDTLILDHLPLVYWFARRRYRSSAGRRAAVDVDDFAQELILRALNTAHRYDPARCKFSTWIGMLANWLSGEIRNRAEVVDGNAKVHGSTVTSRGGEDRDRLSAIADTKADDPAAGAALVRVLVPVVELTVGACPLAWVRDIRANRRVQVPAADVITFHGRLFAVATSFDEGEGEEEGEQLHRVRFGNDGTAWVRAAVSE